MYNLMNGVQPITFLLLPILFEQHPDNLPRFRDCFLAAEGKPHLDGKIILVTRVGGPNRNTGYGEQVYTDHPQFIETWDWQADNTYGLYAFDCPEKWQADFDLVQQTALKQCSEEYKQLVLSRFPKLTTLLNSWFY